MLHINIQQGFYILILDKIFDRMRLEKPKGTRDFSPEEMEKREYVQRIISRIFENYSYRKIQIPTFEHARLFQLRSGEEIQEHMYIFEDKKGRRLCLRPEATASVCRMFSEELRIFPKPLKLYYYGPMFRYEEPQKGRYREFWHLGLELIGPSGPESDAEVILIAYESLKRLGLKFELEIGHLGIIRGLLKDLEIKGDIQNRIIACIDKGDIEGLRKLIHEELIFDLIELKGNQGIINKANSLLKDYPNSIRALNDLKETLSLLDFMEIEYSINIGIARGLEYYTGMVFEIRVPDLGAQNQICGGGRYDELIELFSGISVPAVGFAFGFDRVMESIEMQKIEIPKKQIDVVVAPVSEDVKKDALKIASDLRKNFIVDLDLMNRKLGKTLEYASEIDARYVLIVGKKDLENGKVTLRNMKSGKQDVVRIEEIENILKTK